jgi:hypothetical protein
MFKAADLLGQILRSGMARSTAGRVHHALGPQGLGQPGGPLGEWFGQPAGQDDRSGGQLGGLAESAQEFVGADPSYQGITPPAAGGVAALAGALLGGSGGAVKGALGGSRRLAALTWPRSRHSGCARRGMRPRRRGWTSGRP